MIEIIVNNNVKQLGKFVTLFCDFKDVILLKRWDNVEVKNVCNQNQFFKPNLVEA